MAISRSNTTGARKGASKSLPRVSTSASSQADTRRGGSHAAVAPADLTRLQDGKLYYRIGEVSQITGVKPYVLRYWESEFRLMSPQKSRSKQRLYRRKDIETILQVKQLLYEERYTIAGARRRLRELGAGGVRQANLLEDPAVASAVARTAAAAPPTKLDPAHIRRELLRIRELLSAEL